MCNKTNSPGDLIGQHLQTIVKHVTLLTVSATTGDTAASRNSKHWHCLVLIPLLQSKNYAEMSSPNFPVLSSPLCQTDCNL